MRTMMLVLVLSALSTQVLAVTMTTERAATDRTMGVGVSFTGIPGISLYGATQSDRFVQANIGIGNANDFAISADYAFAFPMSQAPVTPYVGLGAVLVHDNTPGLIADDDNDADEDAIDRIGARLPLGANLVIPRTPLQIGAEVVPTVLFGPVTYSYLDLGIHARVLF